MKPRSERSFTAQKMRQLRLSADLSQARLCGILGIRRETYANYEVGRSAPSEELIQRMAKVLGVDPQVFYSEQSADLPEVQNRLNDASYTAAGGFSSLPDDEKMLIGLYRLLEKDQQDALLKELAESLSSGEEQ